jgi:general secretion pathway protein H
VTGWRGRAGFTLVELVVVLVILAGAAAAAAPALAGLAGDDERVEVAEQVARLLRDARAAALGQGAPVTVLLDPGSGRYSLTGAGGPRGDDSVLAEGALSLPAGSHLRASAPRLRFRFAPTGAAEPGAIEVQHGERTMIAAVDRWTGEVRLSRPGG